MDYNKGDLDRYLMAPFIADHEWSKAANTAFDTLANLKKAKLNLVWISGDVKEKNSDSISARWNFLKELISYIAKPMAKYSENMLGKLEPLLRDEVRWLDDANVSFENHNSAEAEFAWLLADYAEIIVGALKKEMDEYEAELFELNR